MAVLWHPSPTVAEHLAAIRNTPATDRGWRINGSVRTPCGITVPAAWLLEEFPELAEDPLPPFLEGCAEAATGRRWLEEGKQSGGIRRALLSLLNGAAALLMFGLVINVVVVALRGIALIPFLPLISGFVVLMIMSTCLRLRRSWTKLPQSPTQMVLSKDRTFLQDFRMIPLGPRDLLLGSGVWNLSMNPWGGGALTRLVELFLSYFWFIIFITWISDGHRGMLFFSLLLATTSDLIRQYRQGLGAAKTWTAAESYTLLQRIIFERRRRVSRSFPKWWTRMHRVVLWGRRWLTRQSRILRSKRSSVAAALWDWPLWTLLLSGWTMFLVAAVRGYDAPVALQFSLLFFVLARSPFVCRGERSTRYLARRHLQQYDRLIQFHRRWQQREEGKVVKG